MEYKPITRKEALSALVSRFGGVQTAKMILDDALSDVQHMGIGLTENNPLKASSTFESLYDNLSALKSLFDDKDNRPALEKQIKSSQE